MQTPIMISPTQWRIFEKHGVDMRHYAVIKPMPMPKDASAIWTTVWRNT